MLRLSQCILISALAMPLGAQQPGLSQAERVAALQNPKAAFWKVHAPDSAIVDIETTKGTLSVQLVRAWSPSGVDHFYNLVRAGYYDDTRFFRVLLGFVAQFGLPVDPARGRTWSQQYLPAEPPREKNLRGTLSYGQTKPTDRATNVFVNLADNASLDTLRFTPIGRVVKGMEVADSLYAFYGDFPISPEPFGNPARLVKETNKYLDQRYPKLDKLIRATVRP